MLEWNSIIYTSVFRSALATGYADIQSRTLMHIPIIHTMALNSFMWNTKLNSQENVRNGIYYVHKRLLEPRVSFPSELVHIYIFLNDKMVLKVFGGGRCDIDRRKTIQSSISDSAERLTSPSRLRRTEWCGRPFQIAVLFKASEPSINLLLTLLAHTSPEFADIFRLYMVVLMSLSS